MCQVLSSTLVVLRGYPLTLEENKFFFFLAAPCSLQDLSSSTKDGTRAPCSGSAES